MALESVRRVACESADTVYNSHVNPMPSRLTIVGVQGSKGKQGDGGVSGLCCGHFVRLRHAIAIALTCIFIICQCVRVCWCIVWRFMAFIWPLFTCMCMRVSACVCVRETCSSSLCRLLAFVALLYIVSLLHTFIALCTLYHYVPLLLLLLLLLV